MKNSAQGTLYRSLVVLSRIPKKPECISVTDLMEHLENEGFSVCRRVLERDLLAIEAQGYFQIGHDGHKPRGWFWNEDARRIDIPMMDSNTALTFLMTAEYLDRVLPRSTLRYLKPYHKRAKEVLANLPNRLSCWPGKVRVVPRGMHLHPAEINPKVQDAVYDSLLRGLKIRVKYRKLGANRSSEYILNPLGLVVRDSAVNLVATISDHDNPLNFLLHRMEGAETTGEAVFVPRGFSLDRHIETGELGIRLGEKPIKLRMRLLSVFTKNLFAESPLAKGQEIISEPDGTVVLEAVVPDTVVLRSALLSFGSGIEVLEPKALRDEMLGEAERILRTYGRG
jgi:predicted DNA-binding transcriptional regulator YafY